MNLLDIGGGFPGYPSSESDEPSFEELASTINCAIKKNFSDPNIRIIAEPGRFMVASAYTLVTKVTTVRDTSAKGGDVRYYINDGVYGSFNNIIYDHAKPMPELLHSIKKVRLPEMRIFVYIFRDVPSTATCLKFEYLL